MKVQVQAIQFTASEQLIAYIEKKTTKLEQFFDRIASVEVYLSLEGKSSHIKDKTVKMKLNLPGSQMVATESSKRFEDAIDVTVESLRRQLVKYKEKSRS